MNMRDTLKNAREFIRAQGGVIAPLPITEEELDPSAQDDQSIQVNPLEPLSTFPDIGYTYPDDCGHSEFNFFEDGRQRTIHIGFIKAEFGEHTVLIPVHFVVVAAVILHRKERELSLWDQPQIRQGILVQKSLVPNAQLLDEFENSGLEIIDTESQGGDYYVLRNRALQKAKSMRLVVENELIRRWRTSNAAADGFLVVDGTLMNFRDEENVKHCVGVSKSFGTRYFSVSDHNRILQMQEFQRSWAFRFHKPEDDIRLGARERVSWYLRLRTKTNAEPEFGLIRVEMSYTYQNQATELANRFSRSLISERLPTSYPNSRWDKHLYPIQECENYLSSIMPSVQTITASMKGALS